DNYTKEEYNHGVSLYNEQNYAEALEYWYKAAEQGNISAQCNIGVCFYEGQGVDKDLDEAIKWFQKSATNGDMVAQYSLGMCLEEQGHSGNFLLWYGRAATQGYCSAEYKLGIIYYTDKHPNLAAAAEWFLKAAEHGHVAAQNNIAYLLENGEGVDKNEAEAVKWYRKAAEQGDENAREGLNELLARMNN
ncbi:MAG: sel1 repeat family protein, partial [Deferribacteraceae bacterium]|nr:sel1 repeat family protein [Deferribacteraceae bacterium]